MAEFVTKSPWISLIGHRTQPALRLFCFPCAGAGASLYRRWPDALPDRVQVCPVQLPGRENRLEESPYTELLPLVRTLGSVLNPYFDIPFAFFGHSMGGLISFELARMLRRQQRPQPVHLFPSGRFAPQTPDESVRRHLLPDAELLEQLRRLNGTPREILDDPELMQLFLPTLRADFAICETYEYTTEPPFDFPISAFGGEDDVEVVRAGLPAWKLQTRGSFMLRTFPGDHFFIRSCESSLLQAVNDDILPYIDK